MSIRTTSPTCARIGVTVTFRMTRSGISAPPSLSFPIMSPDTAGPAKRRTRTGVTKRTFFFWIRLSMNPASIAYGCQDVAMLFAPERILPNGGSPPLLRPETTPPGGSGGGVHSLLDDSVRKRIQSSKRVRTRNRFLCRDLVRMLRPSPPGSSSRRFSFDGTGGYPVHIEFSCGEVAGIVREPVGKIPGRPEKTARARAHLRGKRRGGAARGPAGALGGRRQLQGRQGFHRRRQGEGAGGRGPFLPLPRPALRQDRPRRDK